MVKNKEIVEENLTSVKTLDKALDHAHPTEEVRAVPTTLSMQWFWIGAVGLALITGLIGFIIGERVSGHHMTGRAGGASNTLMRHGEFGEKDGIMRRGGMGTVSAISDTSTTVKNSRDNGTITYTINDSTKVYKADRSVGSRSDIKVGDTVVVRTDTASSSSQQIATSISIVGNVGTSAN